MKTSPFSKSWFIRVGRLIGIGLLAVVVGYYIIYPHVFHCQTVRYSDFEKVNNKLYVSPDITQPQRRQMFQTIQRAQTRVARFWGAARGEATFILCSSPAQYEKYCHSNEGAGCSLGTPWGDSYIILNPFGLNEDVVSHEMCHDELFTRLGWWTTTTEVPQWFNEGLALMLDRRFVNSTDSIQRYLDYMDEWLYLTNGAQEFLELEEISTMRGFFGGNQRHVMLAYMTAGMEVSRWMALVGASGIKKLAVRVEDGESFEKVYKQMEEAGESSSRIKLPETPLHPQ
ncbi:hypothetical protein [Telluribacter sp. SYSU D00476]|uniref:hypothetical protein n=1 Tax=Telluribacter sp. SYSU D00476 TaxID=2811430 RepID=UPI001FF1A489|nr:hypothetical protein [Telluribacter sp. SYSU D00476]